MDFTNIKKFIELAKQEGVSELKYESKDTKISVSFISGTVSPLVHTVPVNTSSTNEQNKQVLSAVSKEKLHEITSPFVGTFYASAAPGKPHFAQVGQKVSKGQTLCILEAMKIMNEIECDVSGEIVEVCVENESLVEFGQTLFKIRA
jgi:acetyl-CoA carboxylase biotin carboxyl carrier protein